MKTNHIIAVIGAIGILFVEIAMSCPCVKPVANFTFSPDNVCVDYVVSFDGSSSYDPDGSSLTYCWSFGSGAHLVYGADTATPTCTYTTAGSKTVTLTVTDCDSCINCDPKTNKTSDPKTLTLTVVAVSSVTASPTNVCVGQNATFTAVSNPSGKPMNCLQWQRRWKDATSQTWGQWETVQSSANPQTYSSSSPGYCEYQARNGSGDTWKSSSTVTFVGVDKIEIDASGWDDVTGETIVLMQGTKYQFRATPTPSGASWPANSPTWSGIKTGTGETIDVTFTDAGGFELKASCCGGCEKKVTINVVTPVVDAVTYGGGNFLLTRYQEKLNDPGEYEVVAVEVPQYKRDPSTTGIPAYRANPACWKVGSDATATVKFWYNEQLSYPAPDIVVRAETSDDGFNIGDWGDSTATTWAVNWSTTVECTSEMTIDDTVQLQDYTAQWKYKCTSGSNSWIEIVTPTVQGQTTQPSRLYVILDTPQDPQAQPWTQLLDHACGSITTGAGDATEAMDMIWDNFFYDAGGVYDTDKGASRYAFNSELTKSDFILKSWIDSYGNVGTVNCHDMAQAEVIYSNALGCVANWTYVSPFGYLNCIRPIGCGWTNNPFYANIDNDYYPTSIVDGDSADNYIKSDSIGRSGFGNHSFARINGNIYDASVGIVDDDSDPDDPPHAWFPRELDGDDTWLSNYMTYVIDNVPATATGTPTNFSFDVVSQ